MPELSEATITDAERMVLERLATRLQHEVGAEAVWLYGARARGEAPTEDSDIDVLVIAPGEKRSSGGQAYRLVFEIAKELGVNPVPFSIHVWDRDYLQERREIKSSFVGQIDGEKIVLLGEV